MKKILISLLLTQNLVAVIPQSKSNQKKSDGLTQGLMVVGGLAVVAGGCYHAKLKWHTIAWTSKKYLKDQLDLFKVELGGKIDCLKLDLFDIKKILNHVQKDWSSLATKAEINALSNELQNLQKLIEAKSSESHKVNKEILAILKELRK